MYHPSFTIGIKEEYQLIDPESLELVGYVTQLMARNKIVVQERHSDVNFAKHVEKAALEADTHASADIKEACERLLRLRGALLELAGTHNFKLAAAGTHPFSSWEKASLLGRYRTVADDVQMIARRMLAFGLHVYIGVEDRELAVDVVNTMRYLLPHILSLSTSSPFWSGRNTGLKSYRTVLMDALPRTGIPGQFNGYREYRSYVDTLIRTNSIPDSGRIWFDILPHDRFPALVIRICDMLPNYRDILAVTALIQATVAWMVDLRQRNMSFRIYERTLIGENKWRAVRYGLDGNMIDFGIEREVPTRDLIRELLDLVAPMAKRLNSEDEIAHVNTILERGTNADQQLRVWREADEDYNAVVDFIIKETEDIS